MDPTKSTADNTESMWNHDRSNASLAPPAHGSSQMTSNDENDVPMITCEPPTPLAHLQNSFASSRQAAMGTLGIGRSAVSNTPWTARRPSISGSATSPGSAESATSPSGPSSFIKGRTARSASSASAESIEYDPQGRLIRGLRRGHTDPVIQLSDGYMPSAESADSMGMFGPLSECGSPSLMASPANYLAGLSESSSANSLVASTSPRLPLFEPLEPALLSGYPCSAPAASASSKRPGGSSHARKTAPGHVKRPRNAFILFRSHMVAQKLIPKIVEKDHRNISRIVSHMWKSLPDEERKLWENEAEIEKDEHRRRHPDYKYQPMYRRPNVTKRKVKREEGTAQQCEEIADAILKAHGRSGVVKGSDSDIPSRQNSKKRSRATQKKQEGESSRSRAARPARAAKRSPSPPPEDGTGKARKQDESASNEPPASMSSLANAGDLATSVPHVDRGYVPGPFLSIRRPSSAPLIPPPSEWSTAKALSTDNGSLQPQQTQLLHPQAQSQAHSALFGDWQERLREAAQGESDAQAAPSDRSMRTTAYRKERPPAFQVNGSSSLPRNLLPVSPTTTLPDHTPRAPMPQRIVPAQRPATAATHLSYYMSSRADYHTPKDTTAMLVSPLRSSFGDVRKLSIGLGSWNRMGAVASNESYSRAQAQHAAQVSLARMTAGQYGPDASDVMDEELFNEAAEAAAASFPVHPMLSSDFDVFSFRPDFLDNAQADRAGLTPSTATASSSLLTPTVSTSESMAVNEDENRFYYQDHDGSLVRSPLSRSSVKGRMDTIERATDRRRSTINSLKQILGMAATDAAVRAQALRKRQGEQLDGASSIAGSNALYTARLSQQLLRRWRASFSLSNGSTLQAMSSNEAYATENTTIPGENNSNATANANDDSSAMSSYISSLDAANIVPPTSAGGSLSPSSSTRYHIGQEPFFDPSMPTSAASQAELVTLPPQLGYDLFGAPIPWNIYGMDISAPTEWSMLENAFHELEEQFASTQGTTDGGGAGAGAGAASGPSGTQASGQIPTQSPLEMIAAGWAQESAGAGAGAGAGHADTHAHYGTLPIMHDLDQHHPHPQHQRHPLHQHHQHQQHQYAQPSAIRSFAQPMMMMEQDAPYDGQRENGSSSSSGGGGGGGNSTVYTNYGLGIGTSRRS